MRPPRRRSPPTEARAAPRRHLLSRRHAARSRRRSARPRTARSFACARRGCGSIACTGPARGLGRGHPAPVAARRHRGRERRRRVVERRGWRSAACVTRSRPDASAPRRRAGLLGLGRRARARFPRRRSPTTTTRARDRRDPRHRRAPARRRRRVAAPCGALARGARRAHARLAASHLHLTLEPTTRRPGPFASSSRASARTDRGRSATPSSAIAATTRRPSRLPAHVRRRQRARRTSAGSRSRRASSPTSRWARVRGDRRAPRPQLPGVRDLDGPGRLASRCCAWALLSAARGRTDCGIDDHSVDARRLPP